MAVLAALALASILPPAVAQPSGLEAGEGDWVGYVSFNAGSASGAGYFFRGGFEFSSQDGELDGTFGWSGNDVTMQGVVTGPSSMPRFSITGGVSQGVTLTDVSGGGEIVFTASTCERLEGMGVNWDQVLPGSVTISDAVWWAVRNDVVSDPGAFFDSVVALSTELNAILADFWSGAPIGDVLPRIEPLMSDAEDLAAMLNRTDGCGLAFYRSVIGAELQRFVDRVLEMPGVPAYVFGQVMMISVRAGLLGAGAESGGGSLEARAMAAMADRIAVAIAEEDTVELVMLAAIAADLAWSELETEATLGLVEVGW